MSLVLSALVACAETPPETLVIRAGRLFDAIDGTSRANVRIVVDKGLITSVTPDDGPLPAGAAVIDAREHTVLPGLLDVHIHMAGSGACSAGVGTGLRQLARNTFALLAAGVTTAADLATPLDIALAMRRWVGTSRHRGPRLLVAGPMLTAPNGYLADFLDGKLVELGAVVPIGSPAEAQTTVRDLATAGVDFIKVGLQDFKLNSEPLPLLSGDTLCAAVTEAHEQELRVLAHATSDSGYAAGLDCGVDAFVHGGVRPISAGTLQRVKDAGNPVAPTLYAFDAPIWGPQHPEYLSSPTASRVLGDDTRDNLKAYIEADRRSGELLPDFLMKGISRAAAVEATTALRDNLMRMRALDIPIAMGTDSGNCFNYVGAPVLELQRLVAAGMTPAEALMAATAGSARLLNLHDAIGRIAVGYRADIIVVDGEPHRTIGDIERVVVVIVDGIQQHLEPPSTGRSISLGARILWDKLR